MYKKYKIGSDGLPKYNGESYKVEPERRSNDLTPEWKRRLDTDYKYALRRRPKKEKKKFTIDLKFVIYFLIFILAVGIIENSKNNINNSVDITLSNAVRDFGNEVLKPSSDSEFLHIELILNNNTKKLGEVDFNRLILKDNSGFVSKPSYLGNQDDITKRELVSNSKVIEKVTFELPISYAGEISLVLETINGEHEEIARFRID